MADTRSYRRTITAIANSGLSPVQKANVIDLLAQATEYGNGVWHWRALATLWGVETEHSVRKYLRRMRSAGVLAYGTAPTDANCLLITFTGFMERQVVPPSAPSKTDIWEGL